MPFDAGLMLILRKCLRAGWMDRRVLMRSATALAPTADAKLSQAPRTENTRRRELAVPEVVGRVPKIDCRHWAKPGHGPRFGCRSLEARKRACAALEGHAEVDGCALEAQLACAGL